MAKRLLLKLPYVALLTVTAGLIHSADAQDLPPDDPGVLLGYFSLHHAIEQACGKDPLLRRSAASMMGITEADFTIVARIADSMLADVATITQEAAVPGKRGNVTAEHGFDLRRQAALTAGLNAVRERLSQASWTALHAYINGPYRARSLTA